MKLSAKFDWEVAVRWKAKPEQLQVELDRQRNAVQRAGNKFTAFQIV